MAIHVKLFAIILATIAVGSTAAGLFVLGLIPGSRTITNEGSVKAIGVGVYWESSCTNNVTSIDWGYLEPGSTHHTYVWVCNEGNVPLSLSMVVNNWSPSSASAYITVSWNRESYSLDSGAIIQADISLSVSQVISGITDFTFDITIVGNE